MPAEFQLARERYDSLTQLRDALSDLSQFATERTIELSHNRDQDIPMSRDQVLKVFEIAHGIQGAVCMLGRIQLGIVEDNQDRNGNDCQREAWDSGSRVLIARGDSNQTTQSRSLLLA